MKKPKAEKLKSGNFRARLQVNGHRYQAVASTKKEAQDRVMQMYLGFEIKKKRSMTVGEAIDRYILEKEGVLSASTVRGYKAIRKNYLQDIMNINLDSLTQSDIQMAVGNESIRGNSPKTIRNSHGLLASVLKEYRPEFVSNARLPQKEKYEVRIFSEDEMSKVLNAAKGNKYELPILLASWMGLRMSEVRGIKYSDIQAGRLHVHRALVKGKHGDVEKGPKTTAGDRWIKIPYTIMKLIRDQYRDGDLDINSYICPYADNTIYKNFVKICKEAGVEPCRFHDLRHFAASESHVLGIPDKYSMKRMGHKTDNMLKLVYQHTMKDKEDQFSDLIDRKMEELYNEN